MNFMVFVFLRVFLFLFFTFFPYFIQFPCFFPNILFLFQGPSQDTIIKLHLVISILKFFLVMTVSQACFVFDDLDSFKEY